MKYFIIITLLLARAWLVAAQDRPVLSPEKVIKLVPEKVKGFYQEGDTKSRMMKLGDISYSLAERSFGRSKKKIKILLFDYNNAEIMYKQATRKWKDLPKMESDSVIERSITMTNCEGWESYNKTRNTSQIFLGVCDRFFLTITGDNVDLETLRGVAALFDMTQFPNQQFDTEKKINESKRSW
ncbi:MAG: hypothetical protein L0Y35_04880 [Flammeovirgaceae bacterium]|nr:hypothetical protein [Flammeovirgaceae bacterium]